MKKNWFFCIAMILMVMMIGLLVIGCENPSGSNNNGSNNSSNNNNNQNSNDQNNDDNNGDASGKVTISLLPGDEPGSVKLKLSNGTWNNGTNLNPTESYYLDGVIRNLLSIIGMVDNSKCIAFLSNDNTILNIELKESTGLTLAYGEVKLTSYIHDMQNFPYTSHGNVVLKEKFQITGDPVTFINKARFITYEVPVVGSYRVIDSWKNGDYSIAISDSSIRFHYRSDGNTYFCNYDISKWNYEDFVDEYGLTTHGVTIDVSYKNDEYDPLHNLSEIKNKTSFTITFDTYGPSLTIKQVNGELFSSTGSWDNNFIFTEDE
jgi:hypothetical protein